MSIPQTMIEHPLARHQGRATLSAHEAIAKAILECVPNVHVLSLVDTPSLHALVSLLREPSVRDLLRMQRLRVVVSKTAPRALEQARWAARESRHVVAVLGGPTTCDALGLMQHDLESSVMKPESALCCIVEGTPDPDGTRTPASMSIRSTCPVLSATNIEHLRESVEHGLRLSRAENSPTITLAHPSILASGATIQLRANRSADDESAVVQRRPRGPRWTESGGALRMARRLELNTHRALPSPGDPSPVGFITVGPADRSLRQIVESLGLEGRVPALHLGLVQPIDDVAIDRVLTRCRRVIVLEPEPGLVETQILQSIERLREDGVVRATVYGRHLPPAPDGSERSLRDFNDLHPSILARTIMHLLELLQPEIGVRGILAPCPPSIPETLSDSTPVLGIAAHDLALRRIAEQVFQSVTESGQWLLDVTSTEEEDSASMPTPMRLHYNGDTVGAGDGLEVHLEAWSHHQFERFGPSVVREAAREKTPRLLLVAQRLGAGDLDRLARSAIPADATEHVLIRQANLSELDRLMASAHEMLHSPGLAILLLIDGPPVQFDVPTIDAALAEIDRIGFQPMQRLIWPADRACVIRQSSQQAEHEVLAARQAIPAETTWSVQTLAYRWPPRLSGRIRPLVEQVEVHRSRAPIRQSSLQGGERLPVPTPLHADHTSWRVHFAGLRGDPPGVALRLLEIAGTMMDYHVRWRIDPSPIGAGRRDWAQMTFARQRDGVADLPTNARIPFGEADLLLGFDRAAALRAVGPGESLRVASPGTTAAVINTGLFEDQLDLELAGEDIPTLTRYLESQLEAEASVFEDFTDGCRYRFHNERLADVVQTGVAFQLGLIPITVDAMIAATRALEAEGHARTIEAFEFGRRIALDPSAMRRPREDPHEDDVDRIARRFSHVFRRGGPGRLSRAAEFRRLVQRALVTMPGLEDTQAGREARRDLVIALRRCMIWGGFEEAERLVDLVTKLYLADRGDKGRMLTRLAILPLAESMLIRDAIYMSSMAVSPEHRRRTRLRLNVKRGRGDRIESRYVTRFEIVCIRWRFRVDLRTSDWATRLLALARHVIPRRWRGTRRERDVRTAVRDLVQAATIDTQHYDEWASLFQTLNAMALDGRLRRASAEQLQDLDH